MVRLVGDFLDADERLCSGCGGHFGRREKGGVVVVVVCWCMLLCVGVCVCVLDVLDERWE